MLAYRVVSCSRQSDRRIREYILHQSDRSIRLGISHKSNHSQQWGMFAPISVWG